MDKKEMIIDGVIYNKCNGCSLYDGNICTGARTYEDNAERDKRICDEHLASQFWVVFKQFKRKEQEYEELRQYHNKCYKENVEKLEQWLEKYNQLSRDFYNGKYCNKENCSLLKAKEQECKELKKEKAEIKKYLGISYKTIIQRLKELQERKDELSAREYNYKQALDEIELICRQALDDENVRPVAKEILKIAEKENG